MQKGKNIILPLVLGVSSINHKNPLQILSTSNIEINLTLKCKLLKAIYWHSSCKIYTNNIKYQKQTLQVDCCNEKGTKGLDKCFEFNDQYKHQQIILPPFKAKFIKQNEELKLSLEKQMIDFSLFSVHRSKFVKNDKLQQIISKKQEGWGPLSMDKSERIMLQPQNTNFPVIGIWISSHQSLQNSCNIVKLVEHLQQKSIKKCLFNIQGRKFFYLVKLNFQKNVPELFLVQWKFEDKIQKIININKKDAFTKAEITISSIEQANMQFTLRSDEKVPQTLMNIACSPIKFPVNNSYEQTTKSTMPDSPRFKFDRSEMVQQQCVSLKRLVKSQEIEINDLKTEILRLAAQLRQCKRHKHNYDSDEFSISYMSNHNSAQATSKKLTKSDLNYDQPSPNNCEENETKVKIIEQNIWDKFEIIEQQNWKLKSKIDQRL